MGKSGPRKPSQLSLELSSKNDASSGHAANRAPNVLKFVDSKTIDVRKQAMSRVASSGIFISSKKSK
jgi:hypothetical protein